MEKKEEILTIEKLTAHGALAKILKLPAILSF